MDLRYQYTTDESATTYNGVWLTLAQLRAVSNTGHTLENIKVLVFGRKEN